MATNDDLIRALEANTRMLAISVLAGKERCYFGGGCRRPATVYIRMDLACDLHVEELKRFNQGLDHMLAPLADAAETRQLQRVVSGE